MRMMAGRFRRTLLVLAVAAGVLGAASRGARAEGLAIVGATVVDGAAAPIPDAVVLIDGDRIQAVGSRAQVALPKGITIVDGRGKWVAPGLVDAHVHFFQSGGAYTRPDAVDLRKVRPYEREIALLKAALPRTFARYLLCGVTSVVDVGGPFWNFEVRDAAARTALAPRVAVAGPLISTVDRPQLDIGDPPIIKTATPDEARALVRRELERKPDLMKVWFVFRPGDDLAAGKALVAATVDEARKGGVRTAVHATELETARAAVEAGADVLVHSVFDKPVDDAFVDLLKRRGVVYIPTLFVRTGYTLVLSGTFTPTPAERRWADPDVLATFDEVKSRPELASRPRRAPDPESERVTAQNLKRLSDAGVTIAAGTDAGNIGTLHGPSIFRELRLMADAGLTTRQVLASATAGGARVMGREKDLGAVAPGKLADLLILDRDPLVDVANLEAIHRVVKGGRVYTPEELARAAAGR
ncbi:MAG: amidohydrolase [Acidobacteria bacterium]|nr:MAG: amidohydrolase [Acidobacteriota bacterium]